MHMIGKLNVLEIVGGINLVINFEYEIAPTHIWTVSLQPQTKGQL